MDALEFLKGYGRLCNKYGENCDSCPLLNKECNVFCNNDEEYKEIILAVEQWLKDNPVKTYKDDFLEKFPNAKVDENGSPRPCMNNVYSVYEDLKHCSTMKCKDCWNQEYK